VIRDIMAGRRDESVLLGLDDEDRVIVEAILRGLQDPATLPDLEADFDSSMAAPGIASLIHASRRGNAHALQLVANMAKQMLAAGGDMGILAGRIRPLVEGERDADKLARTCPTRGSDGENLEELLKLETTTAASAIWLQVMLPRHDDRYRSAGMAQTYVDVSMDSTRLQGKI
jgi:hypothetical protein